MSELESDLEHALDRGQIQAWFQPQLGLGDEGGYVGAEALCRWRHPERGMVPPSEFIPIAERTGAIEGIGLFMADRCWHALEHWDALGHKLDVSVNVSPVQLHTVAFTSWLVERIERRGATLPTLEITESLPIEDVAALVPRLDELRALGFGIAIDDFGIGQASMTQLRRLHGTELKIDRSLVIDNSERTTEALAQVVRTAHDTGIRVVAEGIETYEQLARVRELGCDRAQGYLIARPMPIDEMDALLLAS